MTNRTTCRTWNFAITRVAINIAMALEIAFSLLVLAAPAQGQTYSIIHNFAGGGDGVNPSAKLIIDRAGNLYGTTRSAGFPQAGTVFKLSNENGLWNLTSLYVFSGYEDGANPYAPVIISSDGTLYGTTNAGGDINLCDGFGCGVVYSVPISFCGNMVCRKTDLVWKPTVISTFEPSDDNDDGASPKAGLTFDQAGNLYGTTSGGGSAGSGTVYELSPSHEGWTRKTIYSFTGVDGDGWDPISSLVFDQAGNLYGTTNRGGSRAAGIVYELTPSQNGWTETVLYSFIGDSDGRYPQGGVIFDQAGNLYGTTWIGGDGGNGTVFKLSPSQNGWILTTLYSFSDGGGPLGDLAIDAAGNLYGTTNMGGLYCRGSVFKLTPNGDNWTYTLLHSFIYDVDGQDGQFPYAGVTLDANGNIFGTTYLGGTGYGGGDGIVYEITPN